MGNLSTYTNSLVDVIKKITKESPEEDTNALDVSRTVSFFALAYEKLRNVIEFKDEHIIRRNAINRIVNRRLAFNPNLIDEALSIAKEIAWAGYYKVERIPERKVVQLERLIEWHIELRNRLTKGEARKQARYYAQFIRDMLVCATEELFAEEEFQVEKTFVFYFYQVLNPSVVIEGIEEEKKNLLFYIAVERTFLKSDTVYLRYHLFKLMFEHLLLLKKEELPENLPTFKKAFRFIDKQIDQPAGRKITKFLRNHRPAYLILKELVLKKKEQLDTIFADEKKLEALVDDIAREKYALSRTKLQRAGVRSFLYIFITKMLLVFAVEFPLMQRLSEELNYTALGINALFPPVLMALFVVFSSVPGEDNTKKIIGKIKQFVYAEKQSEIYFKHSRHGKKNLFFSSLFWSFYFMTYAVTFLVINDVLTLLQFPLLSKVIFFFFVTAVSFFGYRIRQVAKEYVIKEREGILTPIIDFFMVPLISVGKWLSSEISRINVLIFVFDFLIEAPFKLLFEVVEEWIHFVKRRKEDIV